MSAQPAPTHAIQAQHGLKRLWESGPAGWNQALTRPSVLIPFFLVAAAIPLVLQYVEQKRKELQGKGYYRSKVDYSMTQKTPEALVVTVTVNQGAKFRIESSHGNGGGYCFGAGLCQSYEDAGNGKGFATTIIVAITPVLIVLWMIMLAFGSPYSLPLRRVGASGKFAVPALLVLVELPRFFASPRSYVRELRPGPVHVCDARGTRLVRRHLHRVEQPIDEGFAQRRLLVGPAAELRRELSIGQFTAVRPDLYCSDTAQERRRASVDARAGQDDL